MSRLLKQIQRRLLAEKMYMPAILPVVFQIMLPDKVFNAKVHRNMQQLVSALALDLPEKLERVLHMLDDVYHQDQIEKTPPFRENIPELEGEVFVLALSAKVQGTGRDVVAMERTILIHSRL